MAWTPRDAEEARCKGGSGTSNTITEVIRDQEIARVKSKAINWTGRDAEEAKKGAIGH